MQTHLEVVYCGHHNTVLSTILIVYEFIIAATIMKA